MILIKCEEEFNKAKQKYRASKQARIGEFNPTSDERVIKYNEQIAKVEGIINGQDHDIIFGIHPEAIVLDSEGEIDATVSLSELLGDEYYVHFDFASQSILSKISSETLISKGDHIKLKMKQEKIHLFDVDCEKTIC